PTVEQIAIWIAVEDRGWEELSAHASANSIHSATAVALAAAHGMEYLLTWNCKHINNHRIRSRIERACEAAGLLCPDICTPAELMRA
ncbi:MAG: DNA-binding protein, partial [Chthoniobacteraceae bacterium]